MRVTILSWLEHEKDNDEYLGPGFSGDTHFKGRICRRHAFSGFRLIKDHVLQVCPDLGFKVGSSVSVL